MTSAALRVVLFREGDLWIAQGLEHDVGVQAENLRELMRRLAMALAEEGDRLTTLPPAPDYFQALWTYRAGDFTPACEAPALAYGIVA